MFSCWQPNSDSNDGSEFTNITVRCSDVCKSFLISFYLLQVYKEAMENLLPTPAKSHYTFNLRDFSRVIRGCLLLKKESLEHKHTMIRLFVHEVFRVYYDRLVDDKDRAWLFNLMNSILRDHFKESFEQVFDHLKKGHEVSQGLVFPLDVEDVTMNKCVTYITS